MKQKKQRNSTSISVGANTRVAIFFMVVVLFLAVVVAGIIFVEPNPPVVKVEKEVVYGEVAH